MDITILAAWGELLGGIAVFASLIYLATQIRQGSRLLRASTMTATAQVHQAYIGYMVQDEELQRIYWDGLADPQSLSDGAYRRLEGLLSIQIQGLMTRRDFALQGVLQDGQVAFRYRDRAEGKRSKILELSIHEFIRRFLLHALPQGFVRIRHYGLLANRCRNTALAKGRALLPAHTPPPCPENESVAEKLLRLTGTYITQCPWCREGRMKTIGELAPNDPRARLVEILDSSWE